MSAGDVPSSTDAPPRTVPARVPPWPPAHGRWALAASLVFVGLAGWARCRGYFPGESADRLATAVGASPLPTLQHIVWEAITRTLWKLGGLHAVTFFNVLCGGVIVALLYRLGGVFRTGVELTPLRSRTTTSGEEIVPAFGIVWRDLILAHVPSLAMVLVAAGSFPFLFISTRAHPAPFGLLLLASASVLLNEYGRTGRRRWAILGAAVMGIACADSPSILPVVPLIGIWAMVLMARYRDLILPMMPDELAGHTRLTLPLTLLAVWLATWWILLLARAALFLREPAAAWVHTSTFGGALREVVVAQWRALKSAAPSVGWLLPALVVGLPALTSAAAIFGERPGRRWTPMVVHLLVLIMAVAIAWDMRAAPWPVFGAVPLYILPYLLTGIWTAASMAAVIRMWLRDLERTDLPTPLASWDLGPTRRRIAAATVSLAILLPLAGGALRHVVQCGHCDSAPFERFAQTAIEETGEAETLVVASPIESILALHASHGHPRVLSLLNGQNPAYLRWLAAAFPAESRARTLAESGLQALLVDWVQSDRSITGRMAVVDIPDLWRIGGYIAQPGRAVYRGVVAPPREWTEVALARFGTVTAELAEVRAYIRRLPKPFQPYGEWLMHQHARLLNDTAFELELLDHPRDARAMYEAILFHLPQHFSARHNLVRLARQLGDPDANSLQQRFQEWLQRLGPKIDIATLARAHGRIHDPALATMISRAALHSGVPDAALAELLSAVARGSPEHLRLALIAALERTGRAHEARTMIEDLVRRYPNEARLRLVLTYLALGQGDLAAAKSAWAEAAQLAPDSPNVQVARAWLSATEGQLQDARQQLTSCLSAHPDLLPARVASLWVAWLARDHARVRLDADWIRTRAPHIPFADVVLALSAWETGRRHEARQLLQGVVIRHPSWMPAWELLVEMDRAEQRPDLGREHVQRMLAIQPRHPKANHYMASLLMREERWAGALSFLRTAQAAGPETPELLNDLAWCLYQLGQLDEAAELIGRARQKDPSDPVIMDTEAMILAARGELEAAERLLLDAAALAPNHPEIAQHLNQVRQRRASSSGSVGEERSHAPSTNVPSRTAPSP